MLAAVASSVSVSAVASASKNLADPVPQRWSPSGV